jgi:UrcA family protein
MRNSIFNNVATAAAFSLAVLISSQAGAEEMQEQALSDRTIETQSISIAYNSSDLATDEGRANLYGKIKRAAKAVCGPTGSREAGGLSLASRNRECYQSAMEAALSQVDTGQLVSLAN